MSAPAAASPAAASAEPAAASTNAATAPIDLGVIEADSGDDDSALGSGVDTDTTSLSSTLQDYVFENGRRYHRYLEGKYPLPNDETEQDRIDLHHHICLLSAGGNITFAPVQNPQRILDVGTGTGIWALDAAETWPSAEVIGTDLSPIQPTWTFANCRFEIDDAENTWTWPADHFDLIHSRFMAQTIRDWDKYLGQIYTHTKPGGYTEIVEIYCDIFCDDGSLPADGALRKYYNKWNELAEIAFGRKQPLMDEYIRDVEKAGFVDVKCYKRRQFLSPWPKDPVLKQIGRYGLLNIQTGFHAYGMALFTRLGGMTVEEATAMCEAAAVAGADVRQHCYNKIWFIVGRKPGGSDDN
ncbi:S-adenosyl-L-methionine-dependent methyltransferase [Tricharina praecox]|uniref:S-adenosyl-L-methionine-dependent methyltransferase n=1 Tax=Tricharina praecox TaxID=43433 RepID=UPI0022210341|nr:S-adenosyl-L-methionine-dependent methyltransferase [Tricharina praecox]KAI5848797.1 S-adenosyl-L-methionine-dependent methyltransferase [Tricharina praecox]